MSASHEIEHVRLQEIVRWLPCVHRTMLAFGADGTDVAWSRVMNGYMILDRHAPGHRVPSSFVPEKFAKAAPLLLQGLNISQVSRRTGFDRHTIRHYKQMLRK